MKNLVLLILRVTVGALLAGHGAQKLFGWFGGHGLQGTSGWLESLGMRPGKPWALMAGASEFGGGVLMLLGFLNPLGEVGAIGAMTMATGKVHWGKPIWAGSGGAELTLTNIAIALAVALLGPGKLSVDGLFGIKLPRWLIIPGLLGVAGVTAYGMQASAQQPQIAPEEEAGQQLQAHEEASQLS